MSEQQLEDIRTDLHSVDTRLTHVEAKQSSMEEGISEIKDSLQSNGHAARDCATAIARVEGKMDGGHKTTNVVLAIVGLVVAAATAVDLLG